jgi:hypothetical protein
MNDGYKELSKASFAAAPGSASGRQQHFKFDLGDRVLIREIQRPGKVEALMIDFLGVQFRVVYWDNSKRENAWLGEDELDHR